MAVLAHLRGLSSWVDDQAERVLVVGSTCALGGDPTWDAVLRDHGVQPLPPEERQKHITEGPKRTRGALPIEVRLCITSIYDRARDAVRAMDMKSETPEENDLVRAIEQRLVVVVDFVTSAHLHRVTPVAPTTSSIFANARATTPSYGGGVKAGMNQMKCTACGAPRKTEDPSVGPCVFCGGKMA
jgi:hypothetical protein